METQTNGLVTHRDALLKAEQSIAKIKDTVKSSL